MPMSVGHLIKDRRKLVLEEDEGESLTVVYTPVGIAPALLSEVAEAEASQDGVRNIALICEALSQVILEWDLVDEHGNTIPLTKDAIMQLPVAAILFIWRSLVGDVSPDPTSAEPSGVGSPPKGE